MKRKRGMRTDRISQVLKGLVMASILGVFLLQVGFALGSGHVQTSQVDGVTVTFKGEDTEQGRKDVEAVKKAFDDAVAKSKTMKEKVLDAGGKLDNQLTINLKRNNDEVAGGYREIGTNNINVDLSDMERIKDYLTSEKDDREKAGKDIEAVVDTALIRSLAHEIDHARDGKEKDPKKMNHSDPPKQEMGPTPIGPADKDANDVMKDLGTGVSRNDYVTNTADGNQTVTFTVNGQKVTFNVLPWYFKSKSIEKAKEQAKARGEEEFSPYEFAVEPRVIRSIPGEPCGTRGEVVPILPGLGTISPLLGQETDIAPSLGQETISPSPERETEIIPIPLCYPLPSNADADLDGVSDSIDNCLGLSNPQQADYDGDGIGSGCEPDGDNDGFSDPLEAAMGSFGWDPQSTLEHWTDPRSCFDGVDNDKDGFIDASDMSCLPPPGSGEFPQPVKDVYPPYLRMDLGGVHEGTDSFPSILTLLFDRNLDGKPDETVVLKGPTVIWHGDSSNGDRNGLKDFAVEIEAMDLSGVDSVPIRLSEDFNRKSTGVVKQRAPDRDFPADSFFDVFFQIDFQGQPSLKSDKSARYQGIVSQWPPYGQIWDSNTTVMLMRDGIPMAQILGSRFEVLFPFLFVKIKIKPGSFPASINCKNPNVNIPIAVLSSPNFDASTIDLASVNFAGATKEIHNKLHIEDVNDDGRPDGVLHFRLGDTTIKCGDIKATLTGKTVRGVRFQGTDSIRTVDK